MRYDILTGLMLGDGYIGYPNKGSKMPRLEIERTADEYDYHQWIYENLGVTEWRAEQERRKPNGYHGIKIKSACMKEFIPIHEQWYSGKRRVIPRNWIKQHFNEVSLAVWFMDDGHTSLRESRTWSPNANTYDLTICSQNFTIEEMEWMVEFLETKYGIRFHIDSKGRLKLYRREAVHRLFDLISPTVEQVPSMSRKIRRNS